MALNFPAKIYQILENESCDIIRWHLNGTAFRIVDHGRFEREIIPKYFRHNQISSVQRQLNLYGFKCISRGEDKGAFFHSKFRRGDWEEVKRITRYTPNKKGGDDSSISQIKQDNSPSPKPFDSVVSAAENIFNQIVQSSSHNFTAHPPALNRYSSFPYPNNNNEISSFMPPTPTNWYGTTSTSSAFHANMPPSNNTQTNKNTIPIPSTATTLTMPVPIVAVSGPTMKNNSMTVTDCNSSPNPSTTLPMQQLFSVSENKNLVKVVNDVVTIDPYFDFENEFDFLNDAMSYSTDQDSFLSTGGSMTVSHTNQDSPSLEAFLVGDPSQALSSTTADTVTTAVNKKTTCEIGINTDLSQANMGPLAAELMYMFPRPY